MWGYKTCNCVARDLKDVVFVTIAGSAGHDRREHQVRGGEKSSLRIEFSFPSTSRFRVFSEVNHRFSKRQFGGNML
jgi:hypothetical protein